MTVVMARGMLYVQDVRSSNLRLLLPLLFLSDCVIETKNDRRHGGGDFGDEMPAALDINAALLFTAGTDSPVFLVGAETAMEPGAKVRVINPARSNWLGEADVAGDGSFSLPVNGALGEQVSVLEILDGITREGLTLTIGSPSVDAYAAQSSFDTYVDTTGTDPANADLATVGAVVVYPPDSTGNVTVIGTSRAGMLVVVTNLTLGNATTATVALDGSFTARLPGAVGHELGLFAVEPATSNAGPAPIRVVVP